MATLEEQRETDVETDVDTPAETDVDTPAETDVDTPAETDVDTPAETDVDTPAETDVDVGDEVQRRAQQEAARETEALMEERGKKLDRVGKYVGTKLVEIFGDEAADELELCELCTWTHTYGWRVPMLPPKEVREAVKLAIGLGTIDELNAYSAFNTCETCKGLGNVKTGSQVIAHMHRQCPSCKGRGYSSTLDAADEQVIGRTAVAATPREDGGPAVEPDFDMFGTPADHPDYGKLAQHRQVPVSHWAHNLAQ